MRLPFVFLVGSAATRVALGAEFTLVVTRSLSSVDAKHFFLLLYLQGGLIAFLSASAFARAVAIGARPGQGGPAARRYARFLGATCLLALLIAILYLPGLSDVGRAVRVLLAGTMILGAALAAFNGLLQGLVTARVGRAQAFAPSLAANVASIALAPILLAVDSLVLCALAWLLVQAATVGALLVMSPTAREILMVPSASPDPDATGGDSAIMFSGTGLANLGSVGGVHMFRVNWSARQSNNVGELGFSAARLSDLLLQVVYMALASRPVRGSDAPVGLERIGPRIALGAGTACVGALASVALLHLSRPTLAHFALAETVAFPLRVLASFCLLSLLRRLSIRGYIATVVASAVVAGGLSVLDVTREALFGLEIMQIVVSVAIVVVFALTRPDVRPDRAEPPEQSPELPAQA